MDTIIAKIPSGVSGTYFQIPKYQPKEYQIGDETRYTKNYIEEVKYILDPDGDGCDKYGNKVSEYRSSDWLSYYDIQGNISIQYDDFDNDENIDCAFYKETADNGNIEAYYGDANYDGTIDFGNYYIYEKDGNFLTDLLGTTVEKKTNLIDKDNSGSIDEVIYTESKGRKTKTQHYDFENDGTFDETIKN